MALITCSECGGQVSSTAAACPHCGAPVSAAPAAEERKCEECGAVLPDGAAACPNCGCPTEVKSAQPVQPVQPAQAAQTVYTAPTVAPARVQLGSAKARITEEVNRKTAGANVWFMLSAIAAIGMYIPAFVKYTKVVRLVDDFTKNHQIAAAIVENMSETIKDILNSVNIIKWFLIICTAIMAIEIISSIVQMNKKMTMKSVIEACAALGIWIPMNIMSRFFPDKFDLFIKLPGDIQDIVQVLIDSNFKNYTTVCAVICIVLLFISSMVAKSVPKESDYCSNCGRYIKKEGAGGVCKGCGQRKYIPGFMPIPRDIVAAYPYSGEALVGMSPEGKGHAFGTIMLTLLVGVIGVGCMAIAMIYKIPMVVIVGIAICIFSLVHAVRNFIVGARDKITVTPAEVMIKHVATRKSVRLSPSEITDVLTSESGNLAVCARGKAFIFTDISCRAQIAAALVTLTSQNQTN